MQGLKNKISIPESPRNGWPWTEETDPALYDPSIDWPKISIVTPSYNQGQYIEETIRSVLLQNYPNLEYIIIDGGSKDETVDIIKKYEPWLTYWVSEPDRGQSHAINKGLEKCTGAIFNWLNSDDWYEPKALFYVGSLYRSGVAKKLCFLQQNVQDGKIVAQSSVFPKASTVTEAIATFHYPQPACFYAMDSIRKMGPLNESVHYAMDWEWWLRYLLINGLEDVVSQRKVTTNFRLHETSKTNSGYTHFVKDQLNILSWLAAQQQASVATLTEGTSTEYNLPEEIWQASDIDFSVVLKQYLWKTYQGARKSWKDDSLAEFLLGKLEMVGLNPNQKKLIRRQKIKTLIKRIYSA